MPPREGHVRVDSRLGTGSANGLAVEDDASVSSRLRVILLLAAASWALLAGLIWLLNRLA